MGSRNAPLAESVHFRKWPAQPGYAWTLGHRPTSADNKFGGPKQARPRPSGIGGLQGQGRAGHASTRDLRNQFRFLTLVPYLFNNCAKILSDRMRKACGPILTVPITGF